LQKEFKILDRNNFATFLNLYLTCKDKGDFSVMTKDEINKFRTKFSIQVSAVSNSIPFISQKQKKLSTE
jgi:hypothetical protein